MIRYKKMSDEINNINESSDNIPVGKTKVKSKWGGEGYVDAYIVNNNTIYAIVVFENSIQYCEINDLTPIK